MKIPNKFKSLINDTFYDKDFAIYETIEEVNEELEIIKSKGNLKNSFKGNIRPSSGEIALRDYGLNIEASYLITCDNALEFKGDEIISFNDEDFNITGVLKYDTHIKVFIKKV